MWGNKINKKAQSFEIEMIALTFCVSKCPEQDSNLHGDNSPQGPQPCVSTNSTTWAYLRQKKRECKTIKFLYTEMCFKEKFNVRIPLPTLPQLFSRLLP